MRILFFDGYCNLCNGLVEWLLRVDRGRTLKYASLQGETARALLPGESESAQGDPGTVIYLRDGERLVRSAAILRLLGDLGGVWRLAAVFLLVPGFLRDLIYRWVARNRYRIFGKRETCRLPTSEEKSLLLP